MKARIVITVILICLLASVLTACEPGAYWKIHNGTDRTLEIFIAKGNDNFRVFDSRIPIGWVEPGQELEGTTIANKRYYRVDAADSLGNLVWSGYFTFEELKRADWKVKIQPLD